MRNFDKVMVGEEVEEGMLVFIANPFIFSRADRDGFPDHVETESHTDHVLSIYQILVHVPLNVVNEFILKFRRRLQLY